MQEMIKNMLIDPATKQPSEFVAGYFAGVLISLAVILLLLVIRIILGFIFSSRRCKGIEIQASDGDMFISADAISDLIKSLQPEFKYLTISKLYLYRCGKKQKVLLHVLFNTEGGGMPKQFTRLKQRVREVLEDIFGITSVNKVSIRCKKISISTPVPHKENVVDADILASEPAKPLKVNFYKGDKEEVKAKDEVKAKKDEAKPKDEPKSDSKQQADDQKKKEQ